MNKAGFPQGNDVGVNCRNATGFTIDGDSVYVIDNLRLLTYPLNTPQFNTKMEVVKFLENQGMDYWKAPIPTRFLKAYDQDYLEKY